MLPNAPLHIHWLTTEFVLRYTWDSRDLTATLKMPEPIHESSRQWVSDAQAGIHEQLEAWALVTQHCVTPILVTFGPASWKLDRSEAEIDEARRKNTGKGKRKTKGKGRDKDKDNKEDKDEGDNSSDPDDVFEQQADDCLVPMDKLTGEYLLEGGFPTVMFEVAFSQRLKDVLTKAWKWLWWSDLRIQAVVVYKLTYPVKASGFKAQIGIYVRGGEDMGELTIRARYLKSH